MRTSWSLLRPASLLIGLALLCAGARSGLAQAEPAADGRLSRGVTLEVRAATVGSTVDRLGAALDIPMETDRSLSGERITLYAPNARVSQLQQALASLFQSTWVATGSGEQARYRLRGNDALLARAETLRGQRRSQFLARLLELETDVGRRGAAASAQRVRAAVAARRPDLPQESLDQITADYVAQALLLEPLRFGLGSTLLRTDVAWTPLARLNQRQLNLAATFYLGRAPDSVVEAAEDGTSVPTPTGLDPAALRWPRARVEYRMLYGDRWSGPQLLTRVGTSDSWANALLSSALFPLPDYASLYTIVRPTDTATYRPIDVKIDPTVQTWDQALAAISRRADINVVSDVYLRPDVFRPAEPKRILEGINLAQLLDKVSDYYGYVWWKEGDFYVFRHRMWAEERRVAVPDRTLQSMGASLAADQALSSEALTNLAALSEEQLLTLHLYGTAAGRADAPLAAFDFEEMSLLRAGLTLFSQLSESQRELARGRGVPFAVMNPVQQYLFSSLAYDRGVILNPDDQAEWSFRLTDRFERRRVGAGWAEVGQISLDFDCGIHGTRTTTMAARVPAYERPARTPEPEQ